MKAIEIEYEIYLNGGYKETRQRKTFYCYPAKKYASPENDEQRAFNRNAAIDLLYMATRHITCMGDVCIKIA